MSDVAAAFSSTRIRGFSGHDLLTTTGSSAASHRVSSFFMLPLEITYRSHRPNAACRTMPGFPSYCAGSLSMITSSITCCRCSYTGHHVFLHTRPDSRPKQVRLRYVPSTSYRFLQTPPLASDALAGRPYESDSLPHEQGKFADKQRLGFPPSLGKQKRGLRKSPPQEKTLSYGVMWDKMKIGGTS